MTIQIYNENRLTKQPFFRNLINYLYVNSDVTLRQIKAVFPEEKKVDKKMEEYIKASYIKRSDRRYKINFPVFTEEDFDLTELHSIEGNQILLFNDPFFVKKDCRLEEILAESGRNQLLENNVNDIKLYMSTDFKQEEDSLANYFYHVLKKLPLSSLEKEVYQIIGDVDPNYALKYMTIFLLKFTRKDTVPQRRPDIFVRTLEKFGYISRVEEDRRYKLNMPIDDVEFLDSVQFVEFDNAFDYVQAQIRQNKKTQARLIVS